MPLQIEKRGQVSFHKQALAAYYSIMFSIMEEM
jgi:hypothetical protein